ncbi:SMI1/KNR4 family protein [Zavarzinella formosa]|uniref:SMI1/KNR4 family protein n=1 Tax=Zavarzinella formosa TaxID=360055 RepID=UPI00036330A9|nr:SMI1/KNR4 family protein [Zavarzinella formosa]
MIPSLEKLITIVPPPKRPKAVGSFARWRTAEEKLGLKLPEDYRQFVHVYGGGLFADFYLVHTPGERSVYGNLVDYLGLMASHFAWRDGLQFNIHPSRPGLLVWGHDENGNYYYWLTKGEPDRWTVVTEETRGNGFAKHNCSMVEYLLGVQLLKIKALAGSYPPLVMRCPSEECLGWARGAHGADDPWHCDACESEWDDRESFDKEIMAVLQKHPHRRASYLRKRGHYYPAPRESEDPNYAKLVRRELTINRSRIAE